MDSLKKQTYQNLEVNVLDNNSDDNTAEIIQKEYSQFNLIRNKDNIGFWAGQEKLINEYSNGDYIICMSDVILKEDFIEKAVEVMEENPDCGAVQAKVYQMELYRDSGFKIQDSKVIDTCGFKVFKSRKIINLGHEELDSEKYNKQFEIFAVEGVVPIFRKSALEDCKIDNHLIDPDYRTGPFGYGDDLDLAWRMRLFGWKHIYSPQVIACHDRSTTKGYSKNLKDYLTRIKERNKIDTIKRRLDWRNVRFTIIKNSYIINILKDLPWIILRELGTFGYMILFEPKILLEIPNFFKLLPNMLRKRKEIMKRAKATPKEMYKFYR